MYHVNAQGVDECIIFKHYYCMIIINNIMTIIIIILPLKSQLE